MRTVSNDRESGQLRYGQFPVFSQIARSQPWIHDKYAFLEFAQGVMKRAGLVHNGTILLHCH